MLPVWFEITLKTSEETEGRVSQIEYFTGGAALHNRGIKRKRSIPCLGRFSRKFVAGGNASVRSRFPATLMRCLAHGVGYPAVTGART
jgi:hypothetical protein